MRTARSNDREAEREIVKGCRATERKQTQSSWAMERHVSVYRHVDIAIEENRETRRRDVKTKVQSDGTTRHKIHRHG